MPFYDRQDAIQIEKNKIFASNADQLDTISAIDEFHICVGPGNVDSTYFERTRRAHGRH